MDFRPCSSGAPAVNNGRLPLRPKCLAKLGQLVAIGRFRLPDADLHDSSISVKSSMRLRLLKVFQESAR